MIYWPELSSPFDTTDRLEAEFATERFKLYLQFHEEEYNQKRRFQADLTSLDLTYAARRAEVWRGWPLAPRAIVYHCLPDMEPAAPAAQGQEAE